MYWDSPESKTPAGRPGFALPLALFMLTVTALLAALLLENSLHELRIARGDVASARAQAAAESALTDLLASTSDSSVLARPRGAAASATSSAGADTTRVVVQSLGGGLFRLTAAARSWAGGVRGDAANLGFARLVVGLRRTTGVAPVPAASGLVVDAASVGLSRANCYLSCPPFVSW